MNERMNDSLTCTHTLHEKCVTGKPTLSTNGQPIRSRWGSYMALLRLSFPIRKRQVFQEPPSRVAVGMAGRRRTLSMCGG